MNTRERFVKTLRGEQVDRVPFMKVFGGGPMPYFLTGKTNILVSEHVSMSYWGLRGAAGAGEALW